MSQFRSKLIVQESLSDAFLKDLKTLASLPQDAWRKVCDSWPLSKGGARKEQMEPVVALAKDAGVDLADLSSCLNCANYIIELSKRHGDSLEAITHDIAQSQHLDAELSSALLQNLTTYRDVFHHKYKSYIDPKRALRSAFPVISYVSTSVSAIVNLEKEYSAVDDTYEEYDPGGVVVEPVVVVQFDVSRFGKTDRFSFAVRDSELDLLTNKLRLAKKQLERVKNHMGGK